MPHLIRRFLPVFLLILLPALAAGQTVTYSGTIDANGETVTGENTQRLGTAAVAAVGTFDQTLSFAVSADGTNWLDRACAPSAGGASASTTTAAGGYECPVAGWRYLRVTGSSYVSGSATIRITYAAGGGASLSSGGGGGGGGDASAANQTTEITRLTSIRDQTDTLETLIGTTNTNTGAATTALQLIDNAVGTVAPGTAGANALLVGGVYNSTPPTLTNGQQASLQFTSAGALIVSGGAGGGDASAANQTTMITALQLIDNLPNTIGSTTSGQSGALAMGAVTTAAPTYTTGQTHPISLDVAGNVRTLLMAGSTTVVSTVQSITPGVGATNLAKLEDATAATGDVGVMMLMQRQDTPASTTSADADYSTFRGTNVGGLYTTMIDAAGAAVFGTAAAAADNTANPTIGGVKAFMQVWDGSTWDRWTGALSLSSVAHDAPDSGDPIKMGGYASTAAPTAVSADADRVNAWFNRRGAQAVFLTLPDGTIPSTIASDATHDSAYPTTGPLTHIAAIAHGTNPTAVTAGDATRWYANRAGVPFVIGGHPNVISREAQVEDADGSQTNAAIVTVSAGTKIVVTRASMKCDGSTTGPTNALLGFGTATIPARAHTGTTGIVAAFDGIPAGGGSVEGTGAGILAIGADDEDLRLTMEDPAGGACSVTVSYYTIES